MAVAARPGPSDARVPCPLCGGLIHPIAGKCKHCKAELTTFHAARPAANAPLPALRPGAPASSHANGHARAAHTPSAYAPSAHAAVPAVVAAYDASQPVLPPRPTGRGHAPEPRMSSWRSWPVLVIVLATVAIVVAVVLMVWPSRHDVDGKRTLAPSPAPDRMQTEPDIKQTPQANPQILPPAKADPTDDPWTDRPAPPAPDPSAGAIDRPDDDDAVMLVDPFASPHQLPDPPSRRRRPSPNQGGMQMTLAMVEHMCRKMLQCGADDPLVRATCDDLARTPSPPIRCAAAIRCLRHIDTLACGGPSGDSFLQPQALMAQFQDCAEAVRC
jgi:hypothetical protein